MAQRKVFINDDSSFTLTCPKCGKAETFNASQYKDTNSAARIIYECHCGYIYNILVERRKFYRRDTNLPGIYITDQGNGKAITVNDLSLIGLKFETEDESNDIKVGDRFFVEFFLDDEQNTLIKKEVHVKKIFKTIIGAEFCITTAQNNCDNAIEAYLIP